MTGVEDRFGRVRITRQAGPEGPAEPIAATSRSSSSWFIAYGGSTKIRSNFSRDLSSLMTNARTSEGTISAASPSRVRARLSRIAPTAARSRSTSVACSAPRESASIAIAPVPAYRSRTRAPGTPVPRLENTPSRALSETGRTPRGTGPSRTPLAVPAIDRREGPCAGTLDEVEVVGQTREPEIRQPRLPDVEQRPLPTQPQVL